MCAHPSFGMIPTQEGAPVLYKKVQVDIITTFIINFKAILSNKCMTCICFVPK